MSTHIVGPRSVSKPPSAELSTAYQAGVRAYAVDYYVPDYIPQDTDPVSYTHLTLPTSDLV